MKAMVWKMTWLIPSFIWTGKKWNCIDITCSYIRWWTPSLSGKGAALILAVAYYVEMNRKEPVTV
jgi:hypothetical protein